MSFLKWLDRRDESFGGSAGDVSNAGLDQPENGEREVSADPNVSLSGDDLPITKKNRRASYSKKKCNCK